jgi:Protein of unknown function (DUF2550)
MGIAWVVVLVAILLLLAVGLLAWWRLRLIRHGGVDVALRNHPDLSASRWHLGIGRYHGDEFAWYRIASLRTGPNRIVHRLGLTILARRVPDGAEAYAMPPGATVLHCRATDGELELAMAADALMGFLSWLEAAPPGSTVPRAS